VPQLDTNGLIIAYLALATLLLGMNLYSTWHWLAKTATNLLVLVFFFTIYHSWPGVLGWPTHRDLPDQFYLHAVLVAEPDSIYLWGTEFDHGMEKTVPRAYSLRYTPALHDKVDKASRKLRKGLPVVGQIAVHTDTNPDLNSLDQIQSSSQDVVFIDAPQSLIPGKN